MGHSSSNAYKVTFLAVLFAVFTYTILSRMLIIFLYNVNVDGLPDDVKKWQSIQEAFGISKSNYALLVGPAFMFMFFVCNSFSGYLADHFHRKTLMICALLFNCLAIFGIRFAQSFTHLLLLRALLAFGQSSLAPIGYSFLHGYFSDNKTLAMSVFASGMYSGYGCATLSLLVLPHWGWRLTATYVAVLGIAVTTIFLIVAREPPRASVDKPVVDIEEQSASTNVSLSWFQAIKIVSSSSHFWLVILIATLRFSAGSILSAFWPMLAKRRFPDQKEEFALLNCIVVASSGFFSGLFGGSITDHWVKSATKAHHAKREAQLLLDDQPMEGLEHIGPGLIINSPVNQPGKEHQHDVILHPFLSVAGMSCVFMCIPFAITFVIQDLHIAMITLWISYFVSECFFGPILTFVSITPQLPNNVRSTALAIVLGLSQLLASFAPVLIGHIDDLYHNAQNELLFGVLPPAFLAGILCLVTALVLKK